MQRVGCHQADASQHPCWRRLLQQARSRQSPVALCLFQQDLSARSFKRSQSLFSTLNAEADGTSSIAATFATSMTPSSSKCLAPSLQLEVHLGPVAPLPVLAPSLSAPSRKGYPTHFSCGPLRPCAKNLSRHQ